MIWKSGILQYEDWMFEEDLWIARKCVARNFSHLKHIREDLIQVCVVRLWVYRDKYYEPERNSNYESCAFDVCKQTIWRQIRSKQWQFENNLVSLQTATNESGELTLADTIDIKTESEHDSDLSTQRYYEIQNEVERTKFYQNTKTQEILTHFFQGYTEEQTAEKVGCRRQYVTRIKSKYKNLFIETKYFSRHC